MPTLLLLSDTHQQHREVSLAGPQDWVDYHHTGITRPEDIDAVIHAGDVGMEGPGSGTITLDFLDWFSRLTIRQKLFIGGNHDFFLEKANYLRHLLLGYPNIRYLENDVAYLAGMRIFGSPVTPVFQHMAFNWDEQRRSRLWGHIDAGVEVLITHGPPSNARGLMEDGRDIGDPILANHLQRLTSGYNYLQLHVYGHVHSAYGVTEHPSYLSVNAALCNEQNQLVNKPILISLP